MFFLLSGSGGLAVAFSSEWFNMMALDSVSTWCSLRQGYRTPEHNSYIEEPPTAGQCTPPWMNFQEMLTQYTTRNALRFINTTAIAYGQKINRSLRILLLQHAIAVVFTNFRRLRANHTRTRRGFPLFSFFFKGIKLGCYYNDFTGTHYRPYGSLTSTLTMIL